MRKTTGTRTVETTNFVYYPTRQASFTATSRWTPEQAASAESTLELFTESFLLNDLDADGYKVVAEVFEYELPGLRVIALVENGTVLTVFTVSDDTASKLHRAVRKQFPVTVTYVTAEGEETVRTIEPRSLKLTRTGAVIVKALDRKSGEHRSFRLDRITAYTIHRTAFTVPEPVKVVDWEGKPKTISARAYADLMNARDPREPRAKDEPVGYAPELIRVVTDVYSTEPGTAASLEAPETIQDRIAERFALGHQYAFVTV